MNRNRSKKFGRSGAFRRKQEKLVKRVVETHFAHVRHNAIPIVVDHDVSLNEIENIDNGNQVQVIESHDLSSASDIENVIEVNIENEEKKKDRNFPFNKNEFESMLARWTVENDIKHDQLRGLLKLWNEYVPLPALPVDPRTLLETPLKLSVVIKNDNYWHRGLGNALIAMLKQINSNVPEDLSLKFNTDGITVLKSSAIECWPILCEISEFPQISPEVVGVYVGRGKPNNIDSYLRNFVDELLDIMQNGFMYNARKINIKVKCFIADSPARALLKRGFFFIP